jgi:hypothetical protein
VGAPAVKMTGALCIPAYNALWFVSRARINPLTALQQNAAAHQVKQTRPIRHREADYCGFTFLTAKRSTMFGRCPQYRRVHPSSPVRNLKTTHRNLDDQPSDRSKLKIFMIDLKNRMANHFWESFFAVMALGSFLGFLYFPLKH